VPALGKPDVWVAGDVMLDVSCSTPRQFRRSQEDPTVPVLPHPDPSTGAPGGAANLAVNAQALGARVTLFGALYRTLSHMPCCLRRAWSPSESLQHR
jgi:bifunctional ADP-heptose synthase (sugar kinase/adenylyltransferase)